MGAKWGRVGLMLRTFRDPLRAHSVSYEIAPHAGESSIFDVGPLKLRPQRVPQWVQHGIHLSYFCTRSRSISRTQLFLQKVHQMQARAPLSSFRPRKIDPTKARKMGES